MELKIAKGDVSVLNGAFIGSIVGGIISSGYGLYAHLKTQRTLKEMIKDIENLTK